MGYCTISDVNSIVPSGESYEDADITTAINWTSNKVDDLMGSSNYFSSTESVTLKENGEGVPRVYIRQDFRPLITLTSITIDEVAVGDDDLSDMEYVSSLHMIYSPDITFAEGYRNVWIVATLGYTSCPNDVKWGVAKTVIGILQSGSVGDYLSENETDDGTVSEVSFDGDIKVKYNQGSFTSVRGVNTTGNVELDNILWKYKAKFNAGGMIT